MLHISNNLCSKTTTLGETYMWAEIEL